MKKTLKVALWTLYALYMALCFAIAAEHPLHAEMSANESRLLCWKALFAGPYAGRLLPCVPGHAKDFEIWAVAIPAVILLLSVVLAGFGKWKWSVRTFALFAAGWFLMSAAFLCYWK